MHASLAQKVNPHCMCSNARGTRILQMAMQSFTRFK